MARTPLHRSTPIAWLALLALLAAWPAHVLSQMPVQATVSPFRYLGQQILERHLMLDAIPVGGLSGLDHDRAGRFYAISDDRSERGPARFYTLDLDLARFERSASPGMDGVRFLEMHLLRNLLGAAYPRLGTDPEGIRLDPKTGRLLWVDEGRRTSRAVLRPALREMTLQGDFTREFALPRAFLPGGSSAGNQPGDSGVRDNLSLESIAFDPPRRRLWIANENALLQDGPAANADGATPVRVQSFDVDSGTPGPAHVYMIDPIVVAPLPGTFATNGLTEMLSIAEGDFLMVERSFTVLAGTSIRLYHASSRGATDVSGLNALPPGPSPAWQPMRKRLLLDLSTLVNDDGSALVTDNIEAAAWGPPSPDGRPTLILVSDDNFSALQVTQFIALEVIAPLADAPQRD
jgi:hypothetical protein